MGLAQTLGSFVPDWAKNIGEFVGEKASDIIISNAIENKAELSEHAKELYEQKYGQEYIEQEVDIPEWGQEETEEELKPNEIFYDEESGNNYYYDESGRLFQVDE